MKHTLPAEEYQAAFRSASERFGVSVVHQHALEALDIHEREAVLDIGCGEGELAALLVAAGAQVTGIDYVADSVTQAMQRVPGARFLQGDIRSLPFPDQSFDKAVALGVIGYLAPEDLGPAFREVRRVLRPGGVFLVRVSPPVAAVGHAVLTMTNRDYRSLAARFGKERLINLFRTSEFGAIRTWVSLDRGPRRTWRDWVVTLLYPFFAQRWARGVKL